VVKIEPPAKTEQQAPQRAEPPKIFQKTFPKIESPKPKSKQSTVHSIVHSIDITAFDSKAQLVCYNPGEKKVFLSHLSLRCDKLGFSSVTAIDGIVESEAYFVQKFASPTADASKFVTHVFTDSSWEKFLVRYGLRENECVLWHLFAANDPGYQTIKSFHAKHGASFHSVPVNGTLVFRLGQEEIIQNVDVFAVPVINNTESCRAVLQE
jgi:hypothetical protein